MPRPSTTIDVSKVDISTADKATLKAILLQVDEGSIDKQITALSKRATALKELKKTASATETACYARLAELSKE